MTAIYPISLVRRFAFWPHAAWLPLMAVVLLLCGSPDVRAAANDKPTPEQMIFPKTGDSYVDEVFEDKVVYLRKGVHSVRFVGCEFRDSTLKIVGASDIKVMLSTWRGSHPTDQSAIHIAGGTNILIDGCNLSDVQRGLLVISNSHGDNTNLTLRRTVIRRWASIDPDTNRNEAILVHGYYSGEAYAVKNLVIEDVWVTEWPGPPLCVWECSVDGMTVRRFESDSPMPIRFGIARSRSTQTIDNVVFEALDESDPRYSTKQMLALPRLDMIVGPNTFTENWGSIELPQRMRVRLHHVWGRNHHFLPGEFDSVRTARLSLDQERGLIETLAVAAQQENRPIHAVELEVGYPVSPASFD